MTDLEKVQKTLSDVFDYLKGNNLQVGGEDLQAKVGEAHRIVENLLIQRVVVPNGTLCECEYPIIRQDLNEYCSICQKEVK